jgi:hypothetical protein
MVADHTRANNQLMTLLTKKEMNRLAATTLSAKHRAAENRLMSLRDEDFDRAYMRQMVKDHENALKLFETEARNGRDDDLRAFAAKTLPTLKEHLAMARKVSAEKNSSDRKWSRATEQCVQPDVGGRGDSFLGLLRREITAVMRSRIAQHQMESEEHSEGTVARMIERVRRS